MPCEEIEYRVVLKLFNPTFSFRGWGKTDVATLISLSSFLHEKSKYEESLAAVVV